MVKGVGKNKLVDRLLQLLRAEREYVQLHRDTTVQALTLLPKLEDGKPIILLNHLVDLGNYIDTMINTLPPELSLWQIKPNRVVHIH